ncbi:MAG: SprT family zinc-dependent metalloprotease, partial [Pseudomonadota bacterium]
MTILSGAGREVPVRLVVNPRARRLIVRIDRKAKEAVAVAPSKRLLPEAAAFAEARIEWIAHQLSHLDAALIPLEDGAVIPLRGVETILSADGRGRLPQLFEGTPQRLALPGDPETLAARAIRYLKKEAKTDLTAATARHAETLGVTWRRISVKDTRTRWGSCTADGTLSFSWRLILAEPSILDYVAAHEVAHLIEMNHSQAFWDQVARTYPDWKRARRWLRTHG